MQKIKISPSILSADFSQLSLEIKKLEDAGADMIHVDVMDGHFVPNLTIGPPVIKSLRKYTNLPFDVHLMISPVHKYKKNFSDAGADIITIHPEATKNLKDSIAKSKLVSLDKFIFSIGIRHIGQENAKILAGFFRTIEDFSKLFDFKSREVFHS